MDRAAPPSQASPAKPPPPKKKPLSKGRRNRATAVEKERRAARITELYLQGAPVHLIADELGVNPQTVYKDVEGLRRQWRESAMSDFSDWVMLELERLGEVEREAWKAWRRSVGEVVTVTRKEGITKSVSLGDGASELVEVAPEVTTKTDDRAGDPRFLDVILKVSAQRAQLVGLNAPERLDLFAGEAGHADSTRDALLAKLARRLTP